MYFAKCYYYCITVTKLSEVQFELGYIFNNNNNNVPALRKLYKKENYLKKHVPVANKSMEFIWGRIR
jgi:hypothetical protein